MLPITPWTHAGISRDLFSGISGAFVGRKDARRLQFLQCRTLQLRLKAKIIPIGRSSVAAKVRAAAGTERLGSSTSSSTAWLVLIFRRLEHDERELNPSTCSRDFCTMNTALQGRTMWSVAIIQMRLSSWLIALICISYVISATALSGSSLLRLKGRQASMRALARRDDSNRFAPWTLPAADAFVDAITTFSPPDQEYTCPPGTRHCGTYCQSHSRRDRDLPSGLIFRVSCCPDWTRPPGLRMPGTKVTFRCPDSHACARRYKDQPQGRWSPRSSRPRPKVICVPRALLNAYLSGDDITAQTESQAIASSAGEVEPETHRSPQSIPATSSNSPNTLATDHTMQLPIELIDVFASLEPLLADDDWMHFLQAQRLAITAPPPVLTAEYFTAPAFQDVEPSQDVGQSMQMPEATDPPAETTAVASTSELTPSLVPEEREPRCTGGFIYRGAFCVRPRTEPVNRAYYLLCTDPAAEWGHWLDASQMPKGKCPRGTLCHRVGENRYLQIHSEDELATIRCVPSADARRMRRRRRAHRQASSQAQSNAIALLAQVEVARPDSGRQIVAQQDAFELPSGGPFSASSSNHWSVQPTVEEFGLATDVLPLVASVNVRSRDRGRGT